MVKSNVVYDEEDLEFLRIIVKRNSEVTFTCRGLTYRIEAPGGKPFVP